MNNINNKRRFSLLTIALFMLVACLTQPRPVFSEDKPATVADDKGASLKKAMLSFYKGLESKDEKERLAALTVLMPTKEDIAVLFPKDAEKAWKLTGQYVESMKKNVDQIAAENHTGGAIKDVKTLDLRKKDISGKFENLLKSIPKDIPVFRIHRVNQNGGGWSSTYVFVNNKWVFIRGLENLPEALKK